jgi:glycerol-3-phosphate dehydrogenase (NAD(P)+)
MQGLSHHRAAILGDGQMGLVLADALASQGVAVRLWGPFPSDLRALEVSRRSRRLPGFTLPSEVQVIADEQEALRGASVIINAIPTQFIRTVWVRMRSHRPLEASIVSVSKGIENDSLLTPTQVIGEVLEGPHAGATNLCAMSGPTIAVELARRLPAAMVAASTNVDLSSAMQQLFSTPWLRIYRASDVIGVEMAGATKNVIALAAGMVDGLGIGDNAKSALLARGLAEIARLGTAMGARVDTFFGIAGVGDLATTCFSPEGRNRSCGERLARGEPLEAILDSMTSVVEGVPTTRSVMALALARGVDMPITESVHRILFEGLPPRVAIRDLMNRTPKAERIG